MKYYNEELTTWAIDKIKNNYMDDIALLIGHKHWKIPIDGDEVAFNYFIPVTDKGYDLATTFIIGDIGYDLFPMSWERVEGLAEVNESLTTCLADGVILYAKDDEARQRFQRLQEQLKARLLDKNFCYHKCLEKLNTVMDLYKNMVFEEELGAVRKAGGYIFDFLAQGLATYNGTYLVSGPENIEAAMKNLTHKPVDFIKLYEEVIMAKTVKDIQDVSYRMIKSYRAFLENQEKPVREQEEKSLDELPGWYEEGRYTFRRIYYYCDQKDVKNTFAWAYNFQQEFDFLEGELGLNRMDMMGSFDPDHLDIFKEKVMEFEQYIRQVIQEKGLELNEYNSLEEFIDRH